MALRARSFASSLLVAATLSSATALAFSACSASSASSSSAPVTDSGGAGGFLNPSTTSGAGGITGSGGGPDLTTVAGTGPGDVADACAATSAQATLTKVPVDIILVLDNSGSMHDELQAVEDNINKNFAAILESSGVDYRLILLSRHRKAARAASGESSTSICVEAPLSGVPMCPPLGSSLKVPKPIFGPRFFQFNDKIESTNSFERIVNDYDTPDISPNASTNTGLALLGWSEWLRDGAKKVFLVMTDDDTATDPDIATSDAFIQKLTAKAPELGTYNAQAPKTSILNFTWHSIIGIPEKSPATAPYLPAEPVKLGICTGNGDSVTNAGPAYQDLSIRTGGLRFPICQFTGYDVVFQKIADDVVSNISVACDFDIPAPPAGQMLDLNKVAVIYTKGDGSGDEKFGQALNVGQCDKDTFYIENNRVYLCPIPCGIIKTDGKSSVKVSFECQSTIVPPK